MCFKFVTFKKGGYKNYILKTEQINLKHMPALLKFRCGNYNLNLKFASAKLAQMRLTFNLSAFFTILISILSSHIFI